VNILYEKAYAKLNISLDVTERRADGYHDMAMVMQTVSLADEVEIRFNDTGVVRAATNLSFVPGDERNLAVRAALCYLRAVGQEGQGLSIRLEKRVPVGAGMGGGSSDAAAVLRALNEHFDRPLSCSELEQMGMKLGMDVPYCIAGGTVLAEGRGELLTPLTPLPETDVVICKPDFPISTPELFSRIDSRSSRCRPDTAGILLALERGDVRALSQRMFNVFEDVLDRRANDINSIKSMLLGFGAYGAAMSGTGSAVFALFPDAEHARWAADSLRPLHRETYVTKTIPRLDV
jgi:4-diphosphocytidyl-2-C-methyl-D-erythritol kinase